MQLLSCWLQKPGAMDPLPGNCSAVWDMQRPHFDKG